MAPEYASASEVLVLRARAALVCYSHLAHASSVFGFQALSLRELEDDGLYWGFAPAPSWACLLCLWWGAALNYAHPSGLHALP